MPGPGQPPFPVLSGRVYQILEMMKPLLWGEDKFELMGLGEGRVSTLLSECTNVPEKPHEIEVMSRVRPRVIVLMSGGIDSTIAYYMMVQQYGANHVGGLFLDIGQPYAKKEMAALEALKVEPLYVFMFSEMFDLENMKIAHPFVDWKHIIPLRNWLFIEMGACYASDAVAFSVLRGEQPETGGDKSKKFTNIMRQHLRADYGLELLMPLFNMTKADAIHWFLEVCTINDRAWRESQLQSTVTCFAADAAAPGHCGKCQACLRRYIAGKVAGIDFKFNKRPDSAGMIYIEKYVRLMTEALRKRDFSRYDERRCRQFLSVLLPKDEFENLMAEVGR
jgi:7-cyano-7-deazaguanine synthase in queuosine biosynthesis